jgi:hypothetical protein
MMPIPNFDRPRTGGVAHQSLDCGDGALINSYQCNIPLLLLENLANNNFMNF